MNSRSLKLKIYVGFSVITLLLLVNGLVAFWGQQRLERKSELLQQVHDANSAVLKIDGEVQDLRSRVLRFVSSGYEGQRDEVMKSLGRIPERIRETDTSRLSPEIQRLFDEIVANLDEYRSQFSVLVEERKLRDELVEVSLPDQSSKVTQRLQEMKTQLGDEETANGDLLTLLSAEANFSAAERKLLRYYDSPDSPLATEATELLAKAIQDAQSLSDKVETKMELAAELSEYRRQGWLAVQATQSYLYLLNVVLSGVGSEVTYYTQQLREQAEKQTAEIGGNLQTTKASVGYFTGTFNGVILLVATTLAVLIAGRLVLLIVTPIEAITKAFDQLSDGQLQTDIPATDRKDEIGHMAQAASEFSDRNRHTKDLLAKYEYLSKLLQEKATQLEATNLELDNFAYIASHDLKSPLRGIRQLASWIQEDAQGKLPDASQVHLEKLLTRIEKMEGLLQSLLEYSRIGRSDPTTEDVDLKEVLETIVEMIDNPADVKITWSDDLPTFFTWRAPLEQVLMNLVGNAVKYNDKAGNGTVAIECKGTDTFYTITVTDNGPGIDQKQHERAFQMYQRVGNPHIDGNGMGLAIVKKHVEYVGGYVEIESSEGKGATFRFAWPKDIDLSKRNAGVEPVADEAVRVLQELQESSPNGEVQKKSGEEVAKATSSPRR